jgi:hypothetical protein
VESSVCSTTVVANADTSIFIMGTRASAIPLRQKVESALKSETGAVCIDFDGIAVTQSFMDEFLGVVILRQGPTVLDRLIFRGCSDDVRAVINFVARARTRDYRLQAV